MVYWRVTTPTLSAAARMTPSTSCGMHASPTAPAPHPAGIPTPDMYLRTSARIISCMAATISPLKGSTGGDGGVGGDGERGEEESSWKWLRALS